MSNSTTHAAAPHPPHVQAFVDLANRLLGVISAESPNVGTALDALIHSYVAIVRVHPQLSQLAQRSLLTAARALVATDGAPPSVYRPTTTHHVH